MSTGSRTAIVAALAVLALVAVFFAAGGRGPSTATSPTAAPPTAPTPAKGTVRGTLTVRIRHLKRSTVRFTYIIRNTGRTPIAGLQLNGEAAPLYAISTRPQWNSFGAGVCRGKPAGVLIYWSTGASSRTTIPPGASARFSFTTRTTGTTEDGYSLSWDDARPQFGQITGPAASTLPIPMGCM